MLVPALAELDLDGSVLTHHTFDYMRVFPSYILLFLLVPACSDTADGEAPEPTLCGANTSVIAGSLAPSNDGRGVVLVFGPGDCTATRVGPRELLLAAHCVIDAETADVSKN